MKLCGNLFDFFFVPALLGADQDAKIFEGGKSFFIFYQPLLFGWPAGPVFGGKKMRDGKRSWSYSPIDRDLRTTFLNVLLSYLFLMIHIILPSIQFKLCCTFLYFIK